jgi:nitrogen-specific signal transduction histidine kinase
MTRFILRAHGGSVDARSSSGVTVFRLDIPA